MNTNTDNLFSEIERYKDSIFVTQHELRKIVPPHTHEQGHILVVLDGVATINVERSAYYIPYGYFVWIPPKTSHRVSFDGKKVKVLNIYYPKEFSNCGFYQKVGMYPIPSLLYHTYEMFKESSYVFTPEDWQYEQLATLQHILPKILNEHKYQLRLPTTDHPMGKKIITAIQKNYNKKITIQSIGEEVGLSVRSMSRYLRNELNVSFIEYLRTYRIVMAIKQILQEKDSITNIAYNVGYDSLTAFSNAFYMVTGTRPSHFVVESW